MHKLATGTRSSSTSISARTSPVPRSAAPASRPAYGMLVGHCAFSSNDAGLLVSPLPHLVHIRGQGRLTTLVELVAEESRGNRPGRDVVWRCSGCTTARAAPGRWWTSRERRRSRAPRSSSGSGARWSSHPWNTCWGGAWRWRRTCCAARGRASPRSPARWATAQPARSAPPLPAMSGCRRALCARAADGMSRAGGVERRTVQAAPAGRPIRAPLQPSGPGSPRPRRAASAAGCPPAAAARRRTPASGTGRTP